MLVHLLQYIIGGIAVPILMLAAFVAMRRHPHPSSLLQLFGAVCMFVGQIMRFVLAAGPSPTVAAMTTSGVVSGVGLIVFAVGYSAYWLTREGPPDSTDINKPY